MPIFPGGALRPTTQFGVVGVGDWEINYKKITGKRKKKLMRLITTHPVQN